MNDQYRIKIVLATYNGEDYIATQLESIINQTYSNWELLVSDDGSVDKTIAIIKEYCLKDDRIKIVNEDLSRQGACQNFGTLLKTALSEDWDFVMFADQDDFWFENKIEVTLDFMIDGKDFDEEPKLVYTDFEYADENLNPLPNETYKNTVGWKESNLERILVQNNVYGCTMMINRILAKEACPIPICVENHDYWIALVVVSLGKIVHIKKRTMLYRQHSNNVSGHYTNNTFGKRFNRFFGNWKKMENSLLSSHNQTLELFHRHNNKIKQNKISFLKEYCELVQKKSLKLIFYCRKKGVKRNTFAQNVMLNFLLLKILLLPSK